MVMGQLLHQRNSTSKRVNLHPPRKVFSPMDTNACTPPPFHELQSDQGYSSSMTSDTKTSRSPTAYDSSPEASRSILVPPHPSSRSILVPPHPSHSKPLLQDFSGSFDHADNSLQGNEVSSTVENTRFLDITDLGEHTRVHSKLLPLFCEENSYQGGGHIITNDTKLEVQSLPSVPDSGSKSIPTLNGDSECRFDFAVNVKKEISSPVKFMNSDIDVMWAVKPEIASERKSTLIPSPEKWSNDDSSDSSHCHIMSNSNTCSQLQYPYPLHGMAPSVKLLNHIKPKTKQKSRKQLLQIVNDDWSNASDSMQMEAMDLSLPNKRKKYHPTMENKRKVSTPHPVNNTMELPTPHPVNTMELPTAHPVNTMQLAVLQAENKRKRRRKTCQPKRTIGDTCISALTIKEKTVFSVELPLGIKRILQVSSEQNQSHSPSVPVTSVETPDKNNAEKKSASGSDNGHGTLKQEKKFFCDICAKKYSQRSSLHTHMRIHTGVRPYTCKDCGRSFTDCSTYIKHCRLHTGEKPYACGLCGRRFTQSGNMMRHQQKCKCAT